MNKYQEALNKVLMDNPKIQLTTSDIHSSILVLKKLVDKATPKKPKRLPSHGMVNYGCPNDCKKVINGRISYTILEKRTKDNYCYHCGQALDWSEEEC